MVKKILFWSSWAMLMPVIFLSSCKKEGPEDEGAVVKVSARFFIDGSELKTGDNWYTNAAGNEFTITRLQFFLSDIYLLDEAGGKELLGNSWYFDAVDGPVAQVSAKIPEGSYQSMEFTFGFDKNGNQSGMFTDPPESNMEWPDFMGGGYHYMKMEGKFRTEEGKTSAYATHLGPTHGNDYSFFVSLPIDLAIKADGSEIQLNLDLARWYEGQNVYDFNDIGGNIMGNDSIQQVLHNNGKEVFSLKE